MQQKLTWVIVFIFAAFGGAFIGSSHSLALDGPVCWELKNELKMPEGLEDLAEELASFPKKVCINGLEVAGALSDPEAGDILYKAVRVTGTVDDQPLETRSKNGSQKGVFCSRVSKCKLSQAEDDKLRYAAVLETKGYRFEAADGTQRILKADVIVSFGVTEDFELSGTPTIRAEVYASDNGQETPTTRVATTFVRSVGGAN